jgi:hypothetical protein
MIGDGCNLNETVRNKLINKRFRLDNGVCRINRVNVEVGVQRFYSYISMSSQRQVYLI